MPDISDIDATILHEKLNKIKKDVICNPSFYENLTNDLDVLRVSTHSNIINGVNFRRYYKILRTMTSKINELSVADNKSLDMDSIQKAYFKVLNPLIKAVEPYYIDKPTKKQRMQIVSVQAQNQLNLINQANKSDDEVFKQYDDFNNSELDDDIKGYDSLMNKVFSSSNVGNLEKVEHNLRSLLLDKIKTNKDSNKRNKLTLDIESLLRENNKIPQTSNNTFVDNDSPFKQLSVLLDNSNLKKKDHNLLSTTLYRYYKEGPEVLLSLSPKELKEFQQKLKLVLNGNSKSKLMDEQEDRLHELLKDQISALSKYTIDKYDIPVLSDNSQEFKMFKAPIFTVTSPVLRSEMIEQLKGLESHFIYPGWLLDNQVVVTISKSIYKDNKQYAKLVKDILNMLKSSTGQYWIHATSDNEFRLKGYVNQVFLWFIPSEYITWLGNFSVESAQFPFYLNLRNSGNTKVLRQKRLQREQEVNSLLTPYYTQISIWDKKCVRAQTIIDKCNDVIEKNTSIIDSINLSLSINDIRKNMNIKKHCQYRIDKANEVMSNMDKFIITYSRKVKQWTKKLNNLYNELVSCNSNLSEVDLSYFNQDLE